MTAAAWALAGLTVLMLPLGRAARRGTPRRTRRSVVTSARAGPGGALIAVAAACVVTGGLVTGTAVAMVLCPVTAVLLRRAQARPLRVPADPSLPLCLDLASAALRSGRPLPNALTLAAPAARADVAAQLTRVAALLRLGADPAVAWEAVARNRQLAAVAAAAARSSESGIKLAAAFERVGSELRAERTAAAAMRAHRAGVFAMAPLAACFLPSFVCLGVVPVIVGVAGSVLGTVG